MFLEWRLWGGGSFEILVLRAYSVGLSLGLFYKKDERSTAFSLRFRVLKNRSSVSFPPSEFAPGS